MIYTLTLNPAIDETIELGSFVASGVSEFIQSKRAIGGKGINAARALGILGVPYEAIALVGVSSAAFFMSEAAREGMRLRLFHHPGETRTSETLVFIQENTNTHIRRPAHIDRAEEKCREIYNHLSGVLAEGDYLVLSGSLPQNLPQNTWADFIHLAHEKKALAVLDSSREALFEGLSARPFFLKVNLDEFIDLSEQPREDKADFRKMVMELHTGGISIIVITMGEGGALLSDGENFYHARIPLEREDNFQVYATGSGDAFLGAFLASLVREQDLVACLRSGVAAASASTFFPQIAFFTREKAEEFMPSVILRREDEIGRDL
ncbi:MAG: 1-phosphofructokinase family hexose kinase [Spirochaetota bacterium]|jgi:1-phosphofructokinase family hexose kinase|nr:1-phosphofructokinase family hexose kinase [Spirochaetota bacterium]